MTELFTTWYFLNAFLAVRQGQGWWARGWALAASLPHRKRSVPYPHSCSWTVTFGPLQTPAHASEVGYLRLMLRHVCAICTIFVPSPWSIHGRI